jgi:hypothetical protein
MIEAALLTLVLANPSALAFSLIPVEHELRVGDAIEYEAAPLPSPQAAIKPPRQWITLTNHPGWQGLGRIVNGWVIDIVATRPLAPAPTPAPAPAPAVEDDSYGVGSWLNAVRARSGRGPLVYDANLSANAQANSSRGFGHNVGGYGMGQVVGMGALAAVESMWIADPPHYAILMMGGATRYGLGVSGSVWTVNVN